MRLRVKALNLESAGKLSVDGALDLALAFRGITIQSGVELHFAAALQSYAGFNSAQHPEQRVAASGIAVKQ